MPSAVLTDLAARLGDNLATGGRLPVVSSSDSVPMGWATGGPSTIVSAVPAVAVNGSGLDILRVTRSGTPGSVAEGAAKPTLATVTAGSVPLVKYAGLSQFPVERSVYSDGTLVPVVADTLFSQCLIGLDAAAWTTLGTDAGLSATGATWSEAILSGIGKVAQSGGNATHLVLSPADYAAAVESPGVGYAMSPSDAVQTVYGLEVVISAGAGTATGTGFVLDANAVFTGESAGGPLAVLDVTSGLSTNQVRLAVELFAAFVVAMPGSVAELTVTAA